MQMPGPRDIVISWPDPRAFSLVQKPWGWAHILVQKPRGARGGMVTSQSDTRITFITLNSMTCTCKQTFSIKPGFHFDFLCLLLPVLVFPATLSVFAFCCSSLLFTAFRCLSLPFRCLFVAFCCSSLFFPGFSLLLMSTLSIGPD